MTLDPPADKSIITLWLGNVEPDMTEADIRAVIYPYGQIASFHLLRSARCAFVEYVDREAAEGAAAQLYNALSVGGRALSVNWAKPKAQGNATGSSSTSSSLEMLPPPGMERANPAAYVLPGLPAPVTSWPPAAPADGAEESNEGANKRQRTEPAASTVAAPVSRPKFAPAPPHAPPPSSVGLLAGLSAYGDDEDEEEQAVAFETHAKRAQPAKKAPGSQYPSMNPARMGASV